MQQGRGSAQRERQPVNSSMGGDRLYLEQSLQNSRPKGVVANNGDISGEQLRGLGNV